MLQITDGKKFLTVTKGAFDGIYKHNGYHIVNGGDSVQSEITVSSSMCDFEQKPIDTWSLRELKLYAGKNNIDISGARNKADVKVIVSDYMDGVAMASVDYDEAPVDEDEDWDEE